MTLLDGTELSPALGIGAFAEKTLVAAGQCTKVDPSASPAVVGLLGCGVMAGLGAAMKRRDDMQKMAESNKAFAHYRW